MPSRFQASRLFVRNTTNWRLRGIPTRLAPLYQNDADYEDQLHHSRRQLSRLQEQLFANRQWSVLVIFQGMDTSGKDGAIKHVMSGLNPQGCQVFSFKSPTQEELDHDFLWRTSRLLPERGKIGIFNRSYYEEVLVPRVHQDVLVRERLPTELISKSIWRERLQDISHHEAYLARQGTRILKLFLHISKEQQRQRLLARLENPRKQWKFDASDLNEREHWTAYQQAFEASMKQTSTKICPWYVIPADDKKNARLIVSTLILKTLADLPLHRQNTTPLQHQQLIKYMRELNK